MGVDLVDDIVTGARRIKGFESNECPLISDNTSGSGRGVKRPPLKCLRVESIDEFLGTKRTQRPENDLGTSGGTLDRFSRSSQHRTISRRNNELHSTAFLLTQELEERFFLKRAER